MPSRTIHLGKTPIVVPYTGIADVIASPAMWWGLKAMSLATIGNPLVRVYNVTTTTQQDINSVAGGGIDVSALTSFLGGATGRIAKYYDLTGGGKDLTPLNGVTAGHIITTTGSPNGDYIGASDGVSTTGTIYTVGSVTLAQPFTWSWVGATTGATNVVRRQFTGGTSNVLANRYLDDTYGCYAGGTQGLDGPAGAGTGFYAQGIYYNGTSSVEYLNGSLVGNGPGRDIGSNGLSNETLIIGSEGSATSYISVHLGPWCEFGFWSGDKSASLAASTNNQKSRWGF